MKLRTLSATLAFSLVCLVLFACVGCDDESTSTPATDTEISSSDVEVSPDVSLPDTTPDVDTSTPDVRDVEPDTAPPPPPEHQSEAYTVPTGPFKAGVGVGYINGPVGISMAGYGGRTGSTESTWAAQFKATQGFYGFQTVKAMALEVEGERVVFMKIPTMCSESGLTDATIAKLQERHGLDLTGRIITAATHSHHTNARFWRLPALLTIIGVDFPDEEVIDLLAAAFADAIKAAIDDLGPAQFGFTYADGWDANDEVYRDRRSENDPMYPKDPRLSLFAVRRPDGTPMATIINFGMHGTAFGGDNDLLTEDAPGAMELKFEEYFYAQTGTPIFGMFVQSGGGDAAPSGDMLGHPTEARLELLGETAAPKIFDVYQQITTWQDQTSVAVRSRRIDMRYSWMGYDDYPEFLSPTGKPYLWGALSCQGVDESGELLPEGASSEGHPKKCVDVRATLDLMGVTVPHAEIHQMYVSVAQVGDLFFVSLPGEPAYSTIKYARESMASRSTTERPLDIIVVGYSQDHMLYLTHPDDWFMGGYESVGSLWGPLAGKYLVDRQMQLVDDLLNGLARPVFYEESPNLAKVESFTPRDLETSLSVGAVVEDTLSAYERTQSVRFTFSGGDPSVSSPLVVVEQEQSDGTFAPVPSPSGLAGRALDNSRYHMITTYAPDPPGTKEILAERDHRWSIAWEVTEDFPAGTYRLVASGGYWDGAAKQTYTSTSSTFTVAQLSSAAVDATMTGTMLSVSLNLDPQAYTPGAQSWPVDGWRLLDPTVRHDQPQKVAAPLSVQFSLNGAMEPGTYQLTYDSAVGVHTLDFSSTGINPGGRTLAAHVFVRADATPSMASGVVTVL